MIVIASSNLKLRHHLRCWLEDRYRLWEVANNMALGALLERTHPELLLIDLSLSGFISTKEILKLRQLYPWLSILALSASPSQEEALAILKVGVRGYCSQDIKGELLKKAVERVQQGETWVTRKLIPCLIEEIAALYQQNKDDHHLITNMYLATLTPREREIATLIGQGANNKIIARKLGITERTVKAHLSETFRKLSIPDRLQLALLIHGHTAPNL